MWNTAPKKGGEVLPSPAALQLQHYSLGWCPWAWDLRRRWEEAHAQLCVCCLPESAHLSCWGLWDVKQLILV